MLYLTTNSNVVALGEGTTKTVSVSIQNAEDIILDGYTWISSDPSIVSVISQGSTAIFTGNSIGTAISMYALGILIPKIQYAITRKLTNENKFHTEKE